MQRKCCIVSVKLLGDQNVLPNRVPFITKIKIHIRIQIMKILEYKDDDNDVWLIHQF